MSYTLAQPISEEHKKELAEYPPLLQALMANRSILTRKDADVFLNPDYDKHLFDPFLIKDMDKAVERILSAIKKEEMIAVYSDFDCDGIPGGTIMHDFFKKIEYTHFTNYIPHRHEEGYGVNANAIDLLKEKGVSLIITVDVGITDVASVEHANTLGVDVIVTDHHLLGDKLPPAVAVINSKREDDTYPFDQLCGSGVAFKLVQALIQKGDFNIKQGWEKWLLDVAGIATIADMVPLVGENRVIAYYGLKVLRKSPRPGVMKLCRKMNMRQHEITEDDVGFMIAPRINAASRMDRPEDAFRLLATDDVVEAGEMADHLDKINNQRKGLVASMVKEIKKEIKERDSSHSVIVIGNPTWKPALLGLVANSLVEAYQKPVCLWGKEGGDILKGSCRSDGSVNVVEMFSHSEKVLVEYGGHHFAGGFSVTKDSVHLLEESFSKSYEKARYTNENGEDVFVDAQLWLDDVSWDTYRLIEKLAPFGEGNPKPTFLFEGVTIARMKHFGKTKNHLHLDLVNGGTKTIPAIAFFSTEDDYTMSLKGGEKVDLIAHMERSTFGRTTELRLRIVAII